VAFCAAAGGSIAATQILARTNGTTTRHVDDENYDESRMCTPFGVYGMGGAAFAYFVGFPGLQVWTVIGVKGSLHRAPVVRAGGCPRVGVASTACASCPSLQLP